MLALAAILAGAGVWYAQTRAYYRQSLIDTLAVAPADESRGRVLLSAQGTAIDSESSPLRFRACLELSPADAARLRAVAKPATNAMPLVAPRWFSCFDAARLAADLAAGQADAWLVEENFRYGFDRLLALYPDGRAYMWHQINSCGQAFFDGRPLPEGCPPPPSR